VRRRASVFISDYALLWLVVRDRNRSGTLWKCYFQRAPAGPLWEAVLRPETEAGLHGNAIFMDHSGKHPAARNKSQAIWKCDFKNSSCWTTLGSYPAARNRGGTIWKCDFQTAPAGPLWEAILQLETEAGLHGNVIFKQLLLDHSGRPSCG